MSRHPEVKPVVDALVGTWTGEGEGQYPTIESFNYRETLQFTERSDHPAVHYEQRAWRKTPDGETVSHWETGLLRLSSDGSVRLLNAQGGRSEIMEGTWKQKDDAWTILLESIGYAGDERAVKSLRNLGFDGRTLNYTMHMETTATNQMSLHLAASLTRQSV